MVVSACTGTTPHKPTPADPSTTSTTVNEQRTPSPAALASVAPASAVMRFRPEPDGSRLQEGAPTDLATELAAGQDPASVVHDFGPLINARGQALLLTAPYGAYRDEHAPCPAPWHAIIRWGGKVRTRLWTAKVAPPEAAAPTSQGFVIPAGYCLRGPGLSATAAANWYVDSRGQIGELHPIVGYPPVGVRADAPVAWSGPTTLGDTRSLLADRDSNRVWAVDNPIGLPGAVPRWLPQVLAQDVTGRRWVLGAVAHKESFWLSDDKGATWARIDGEGMPTYTDTTVAFVDINQMTVSTDRAKTWATHPIPDLRAIAVPDETLLRRWQVEPLKATGSGTLLGVVYYSPNFVRYKPKPPVLVRSTDPTWSHFTRVGVMPSSDRWFVKDDTISACQRAECSYSKDLGESWHRATSPD